MAGSLAKAFKLFTIPIVARLKKPSDWPSSYCFLGDILLFSLDILENSPNFAFGTDGVHISHSHHGSCDPNDSENKTEEKKQKYVLVLHNCKIHIIINKVIHNVIASDVNKTWSYGSSMV